jgi:hypothetical protein
MINKKITLSVALFALTFVSLASVNSFANALSGETMGQKQNQPLEQQTRRLEDQQTQQLRINDIKAQIQQRLTQMKEERVTKLEGKRLEVCQKRQQKIGEIVTHGIEQNKKQLAVFEKIQANVIKFYADKKLSSDGYTAAVEKADAADAKATAAINASAETNFDCATADGANPGSIIKEAMTTRHSALAEYRTAIKELIQVVRKANGQQRTTDTTTKPTNTTEGQ